MWCLCPEKWSNPGGFIYVWVFLARSFSCNWVWKRPFLCNPFWQNHVGQKTSLLLMEALSSCQASISVYLLYPLYHEQRCPWKRALHMHFGSASLMPCCLCLLLQAYSAAVQSQLQWMKQLCLCVEQHVKENTAYFQVCGLCVFLCACLCVTVCVYIVEDEKNICFYSGKRFCVSVHIPRGGQQ